MKVHLVDGTYELFRAYFGVPSSQDSSGVEIGASRGLLRSLLSLLRNSDVTHIACAFDHTLTSFRNSLFEGYKDGSGIPEDLLTQFALAEEVTRAMGLVTWPMVKFEADDILASAAIQYAQEAEVEQVILCSPDKDLSQCVVGDGVVCWDRRREKILDERAVEEKFGVPPASIPDFLALVGDDADGIPGIPRWGKTSAAKVLSRYRHIEAIPEAWQEWDVPGLRGAQGLANSLVEHRSELLLYKELTTLRRDCPVNHSLEDLRWVGPAETTFEELCSRLRATRSLERMQRLTEVRFG